MIYPQRQRRSFRPLEALEPRRLLSTYVWTGAASSLMSNAANWVGDVSPAGDSDATLQFPANGVTDFNVNNDLTTTTIVSVSVRGGGYDFTSAQTTPMFIAGDLAVAAPAGTVDSFQQSIAAGGSLVSTGAGKVNITSAVFASATEESGKLLVGSLSSPVSLVGGVLVGPGSVDSLTAEGGSKIRPSNGSDPGTIAVNGDLNLAAGAVYLVHLNGATTGSNAGVYDQLSVTGSVNLNDATLNVALGYAAQQGDQFTIINNLGGAPVNGTFSGLAQGALFINGGVPFAINYQGGAGNDVVLTRLAISATTLGVDNSSPVAGQPINFSANATIQGVPATTGDINFFDGLTLLATVPVDSNGNATLNTAALSPGVHSVTAQYAGNATTGPSTSNPQSVNVTSGVVTIGQTVYVGGTTGNDSVDIFPLTPDIVISVNGQVNDIPDSGSETLIVSTFGGQDTITIEPGVGPVIVNAGGGADSVSAANGNDTIHGQGGADTLSASGGNDVLEGGRGPDKLISLAGDDVIYGNGGSDVIFALNGVVDTLYGGPGNDTAHADVNDPVTDLIPDNDIETILLT